MYFFENFYFLFKSFLKIELSYVFTINVTLHGKVNYLIKTGHFYLVRNYLRASNSSKQSVFNINAVVLIAMIC